jgi:hypothetical protein
MHEPTDSQLLDALESATEPGGGWWVNAHGVPSRCTAKALRDLTVDPALYVPTLKEAILRYLKEKASGTSDA